MILHSSRSMKGRLLAGILLAFSTSALHAETVDSFDDPSRLVTVGGSLTEIVYALGEGDKLIARDSTSIFPEEAEALPDVGYMRALSPEGLMSVNPSAILMLEGSGPPEALQVLERASIPIVTVPESYDRAAILRKIEIVGAALDAEDRAEELAAEVGRELAAAEAAVSDIPERKRVLFILSIQGGRIMASGSGTAAAGIIEMANAENAVQGYSGYKQLTDEAVQEMRPDVLLMMDREGDHAASDADLLSHPALAGTPAAQAGAIIRMDGAYMLGFGPRTASAVRELAHALYGAEAD